MMTAAMAKVVRTRWPACQLAAAKPLAEEPEEVVEEPVGLQEAEEEAEAAAAAEPVGLQEGLQEAAAAEEEEEAVEAAAAAAAEEEAVEAAAAAAAQKTTAH